MKTASTTLKAHLDSPTTSLCQLYKITRKDGQVFTFTDHDSDIDTSTHQDINGITGISDGFESPPSGGHVYEAAIGFSPTAIDNKADLSVDNQQVTAFIDSDTITAPELRYGLWNSAQVEIRTINWADLSQGELKMRRGILGNLEWKNGQLTADLLGLTTYLQQVLGRSFGAPCDAELGDSRCQAVVPVHLGSVATSVDSHTITVNDGSPPDLTFEDGYYDDGILTFLTGVNSGISFQVGEWVASSRTLTFKLALLAAASMGDTFTITPGCKHDETDCRVKFNNLVNYQGFSQMPGQDAILTYPDATG